MTDRTGRRKRMLPHKDRQRNPAHHKNDAQNPAEPKIQCGSSIYLILIRIIYSTERIT